MKKKKCLIAGMIFLFMFISLTLMLDFIDVKPIGPNGSPVGFATLNKFVHELIGVNWLLYNVTDWLGLVSIGCACWFAVSGFVQLVKRKSLFKVDNSILLLGGFYIIVIAVYLLFEKVVINYRPVLIAGKMEASYPSSTTVLALCIISTTVLQFKERICNATIRKMLSMLFIVLMIFMVIGRIISGVHWLTDIIGGILLSGGLVMLYVAMKTTENI